jgi:tripartite-type tricarboxylate transporter receptor subunit TctC
MRRARALIAAVATTIALIGSQASAQYPTRPIKIVVPVPPGAAPDLTARLLADGLMESLGQPVTIENRAGANGNIAGEAVSRAPADGYTLLFGIDSAITVNPHLYTMSFEPLRDLVAISSLVSNQLALAVHPSVPATTLSELIAYAKAAKPPLAYGSGGVGSQQHLAMEMLKRRADIPDLLHVPYKGVVPAVTGTVAGENLLGFSGSASTAFIQSGRLRGIAVSGKTRSRTYPDLPTIGETYPGYEVQVWFGLFAPAATPEPVLVKLRDNIEAMLNRPEFVARVTAAGSVEILKLPVHEFQALIRADFDKYGKLAKEIGIKPQ